MYEWWILYSTNVYNKKKEYPKLFATFMLQPSRQLTAHNAKMTYIGTRVFPNFGTVVGEDPTPCGILVLVLVVSCLLSAWLFSSSLYFKALMPAVVHCFYNVLGEGLACFCQW